MNRDQYLDEICSQIRFKEVHPQIRQELVSHFDEIVNECVARGATQELAESEALRRLGDPINVGRQLDKSHRPQMDWSLFAVTMILAVCGLTVLYILQHFLPNNNQMVFKHTLGWFIPAIIIYCLLMRYDYYRLLNYGHWIFGIVCVFLVLICHMGTGIDEHTSYFLAASTTVDLVSLSPVLLAICLAAIFSKPSWKWDQYRLAMAAVLLALPVILYLLISSISSVLLYSFLFLILAGLSGCKARFILFYIISVYLPLIFGTWLEIYRMQKVFAFLHPYRSALEEGFYYIQLRRVAYQTHFIGHGVQAPTGLENLYSNFIFAFILKSFGWMVGMLLIILVLYLLAKLFHIASSSKDRFGFLMATGIACSFLFEYSWNIFMNIGLLPLFVIPLPLISFGSIQFIFQFALLGLIMSVYRRRNVERQFL